jgi:hypothetical protein
MVHRALLCEGEADQAVEFQGNWHDVIPKSVKEGALFGARFARVF